MLSCIVVGGGPGGLGPLIWAAQQGSLADWLDDGVAIIEQQEHLGGSLGRFAIHSDSLGASYLECLEAPRLPGEFRSLRDHAAALEMARYRESFPPLELVDRFMRCIGDAVASMVRQAGRPSSLHLCTRALALKLRDDDSVAVEVIGPDGRETLVAGSAIVALGGRQTWSHEVMRPGLTLADCRTRHVMSSDRLLSRNGLADADRVMAETDGRRILILGGAHSAYAAADALVGLPAAARLVADQIAIVQRREPRVFYPDRAAAGADSYDVDEGDICPRTQRINRMGGLRGHGRDMWRRIARRPGTRAEPRVVTMAMQDFAADRLRAAVEDAALVVPCFGYRAVTLPVFAASGERLALNADRNGMAVGADSRLMLSDGTCLRNVFGIGLGTGYRLPPSMGGEPNFSGQANSLWLYHNDIGAVIYRTIRAHPREKHGSRDGVEWSIPRVTTEQVQEVGHA